MLQKNEKKLHDSHNLRNHLNVHDYIIINQTKMMP